MPETSSSPLPRFAATLWLVAACAIPVTTVCFVWAAYSPVQILDQWDEIQWLQRYEAGAAHVADLWRLHNEHAILFPRLFILTDLFLFHGTNALLVPLNVLLQACTCAMFGVAAWRAPELSTTLKRFLLGVYLVTLLSATQMQNFWWGFQITFVMVFAAAVASILCIAHAGGVDGAAARTRWILAGAAAATVATFSVANGVLVWPIVLVIALGRRFGRRHMGLLGGAAAVAIGLRLAIGMPGANPAAALADPVWLLLRCAWYLGSPFRHASLIAVQRFGIVGLAGGVFVVVAFLLRWRRLTPFEWTQWGILAFVLGSDLATAVGRVRLPLDLLLNSRFATPALLLWAALAGVLVFESGRLIARTRVLLPVVCGVIVVCLAWFLVPAHRVAGPAGREAVTSNAHASLALVVGVEDWDALETLFIPARDLPPLAVTARARGLGIFSRDWTLLLQRPLTDAYSVGRAFDVANPTSTPCLGRFERAIPIVADTGETSGSMVDGWAWDVVAGAPVDLVILTDGAGVVRGFALPGVERPDIESAFASQFPGSFRGAGWFGYVEPEDTGTLTAYAVPRGATVAYPLQTAGAAGSVVPAEARR